MPTSHVPAPPQVPHEAPDPAPPEVRHCPEFPSEVLNRKPPTLVIANRVTPALDAVNKSPNPALLTTKDANEVFAFKATPTDVPANGFAWPVTLNAADAVALAPSKTSRVELLAKIVPEVSWNGEYPPES